MKICFEMIPKEVKVLKQALTEYAKKGKKEQVICKDLIGLIEYQEKEKNEDKEIINKWTKKN